MFTTIISITLSVVSACCWLPNLAIVLIYILKMIIQIFSSTFFKNKFPKIGTELMYFCQWRLLILWFIEFVLYQFNISRLFISILKRIRLCSWCPFSFSVLSFFSSICSGLRFMPMCASDLEMSTGFLGFAAALSPGSACTVPWASPLSASDAVKVLWTENSCFSWRGKLELSFPEEVKGFSNFPVMGLKLPTGSFLN